MSNKTLVFTIEWCFRNHNTSCVVPTLSTHEWYRIKFAAKPTVKQIQVELEAELVGITDPTISASISTEVNSSSWGLDSGVSGIRSNRSKSLFSYFKIQEFLGE